MKKLLIKWQRKRKLQKVKKQKYIFDTKPTIFTTGAYLSPLKIITKDNKEMWVW